jgi:predicted lactoylglutathione lyase
MPRTGFENVIPILNVSDLARSVGYYGSLGFEVDWEDSGMASVSRDGHAIMLCEGAQGQSGTWLWIGVEDVAALAEEYQARGLEPSQAPRNYPWAYEMRIQDPDGHVLRFGSEPREELPIVRP